MPIESFLSIGFAVSTLISSIIAFIAIIISDAIIAHNIDTKHSFILAIVALFLAPIAGALLTTYINISIPYFEIFIFPLIIWIILGEILLKAEMITKLKVIIIAFVVYEILSIFVMPYVMGYYSVLI
ncbi:MAG: hypothetical protein QXD48_00420 [Candidatus Aenigmatarchaeota archaeon]